MAAPVVTPAEVQAALGTNVGSPKLLRSEQITTATVAQYYVNGGTTVPGRVRWCTATNTDNAATQAAAILTALRA